jgi:hypothetical protein
MGQRASPTGADTVNQPRDPGDLGPSARFVYLTGYRDATEVVIKRVDELLAKHKYGFDIDSRLLLDEINACEEDVTTAWE